MKKQTDDIAIETPTLSDLDIADAYLYLLGREIILKQQRLDFEQDNFEWNKLIYREPGGVAWANPNLDVVYSEAWIALDDNNCVILEVPKITGRYFTWHMLNGWGETILNINERTFPNHPHGKFALCLEGGHPKVPEDALRVNLPCKTSRVLARMELGNDIAEATRLQHLFKLTPLGNPQVPAFMKVPLFNGMQLPGAEIFENASEKLASEKDINPGMKSLQSKARSAESLVSSGAEGRSQAQQAIKGLSFPAIMKKVQHFGIMGNGWTHPLVIGNYNEDYLSRTVANLVGIWANTISEGTYYGYTSLDGSATYTMTFPNDALPGSKAKYFWSVIAVDAIKYQVLPNVLKRYLLNRQSGLKFNADGSLTLMFGPSQLPNFPASNWLPTIEGLKYNLTFRFYGATEDVVSGKYFLPVVDRKE